MFGADETMKVNLRKIPATDKAEEQSLLDQVRANQGQRTLDLAALAPESLEKLRQRNQWR